MFILYDLINLLFIIAYLPVFVLKKKMHPGFSRRLGIYPRSIVFSNPVWIHAVSVGEMVNMRALLLGMQEFSKGTQYVLSTVTPTGNRIAQSMARPNDVVTYLPLDLSAIVNSVLNRARPRLFIIAETEFWPNLLSGLHARKVPVIIVNGRVSDNAFSGYLSIRWIIAPLLRRISLLCMQTQSDADRVIMLGARPDSVKVTGNMKFDQRVPSAIAQADALRRKLAIRTGEKCLVAGSTHPGEESQVVAAFKTIARRHPNLRLVIAPRHPERSAEVEACIRSHGFESVRASMPDQSALGRQPVFIVDTIGELMSYYAIADAVFVGGSLIKHGGQNFLEPAFLGKPVVLGPSLFNFRDIARQFLDRQAAVLVRDSDELAVKVQELLADDRKAAQIAARALALIRQNQGATIRNLSCIKEFMQTAKS